MKLDTPGRIGLPGVLGLGLLFFTASFYFSALAPAFTEQDRLQAEEQKLARSKTDVPTAPARLSRETPGTLPSSAEATELFDRLQVAGEKNGIVIERATYNVIRHEKYATLQYEITLPLRGSYPNLRAFLRESLQLAPSASLDSLSLQRARASDPALEASVRLSYFFLLK